MVTIDANVFVSASTPKENSTFCQFDLSPAYRGTSGDCPLSVLVLPETAAAIARPTGNVALATQTVAGITRLPGLALIPLTEQRAQQAAQTTIGYRLRGADAVYVAVAQEFGTTLITWDSELLTRGSLAVPTMTPTDWLAANPT